MRAALLAATRQRWVIHLGFSHFSGAYGAYDRTAPIETGSAGLADRNFSIPNNPDFSYQKSPTAELLGKTIGIIGYGRIGRRVAALAKAFEMRVLVNTAHPEKYPDADVTFLPLAEMLPRCDFVTLHCPQTPETDKLVNAGFLSQMKDGAFLVNTSRGGEVDEQALADALNRGKLSGAGVDVLSTEPPRPDNPLLTAKNIFITPHIAWASYETRVRLMEILKENIRGFMEGKPVNVVNL